MCALGNGFAEEVTTRVGLIGTFKKGPAQAWVSWHVLLSQELCDSVIARPSR